MVLAPRPLVYYPCVKILKIQVPSSKERDAMQSAFIQCQPDIMGGTPVFADSRVPVRTLVEYLEDGETIDDFLEGFPTVGRDKVLAFLEAAGRHASLLAG